MCRNDDQLFYLLHDLKAELSAYETKDELIKDMINEELKDIHTALSKWNIR